LKSLMSLIEQKRSGGQSNCDAPLRWTAMASYLADILASHRAQARDDHRDPDELAAEAAEAMRVGTLPIPRDFAGALRGPGISCIAEVKRRSPSKGDLDRTSSPIWWPRSTWPGCVLPLGADRREVLRRFGAGPASGPCGVGLPVLRKDFTVTEVDVIDARLMGPTPSC